MSDLFSETAVCRSPVRLWPIGATGLLRRPAYFDDRPTSTTTTTTGLLRRPVAGPRGLRQVGPHPGQGPPHGGGDAGEGERPQRARRMPVLGAALRRISAARRPTLFRKSATESGRKTCPDSGTGNRTAVWQRRALFVNVTRNGTSARRGGHVFVAGVWAGKFPAQIPALLF